MRRLWRSSGAVLALLGGCTTAEVVPLYGVVVPDTGWYYDDDVSGTTLDAQTSQPIPSIQVSFQGEVTRSDADGAWSLDVPVPCVGDDCVLLAQDIDGPTHGSYLDAEIDLENTDPDAGVSILMEPAP